MEPKNLENHKREYVFDDSLPKYNTGKNIVMNKLSICPKNFKIPNSKLPPKPYHALSTFFIFTFPIFQDIMKN